MNDDKPGVGQFICYLREKRSLWLIAVALILGVCLMLFGGGEDAQTVSASMDGGMIDTSEMEARVAALCGRAAGVSDVTVMITLDTLGEQVYAQNVELDEAGERREYISTSQGLIPTVEITPRVRGIAIVCDGGDDANIRLKLTNLLCALFGIPASSISIVGSG